MSKEFSTKRQTVSVVIPTKNVGPKIIPTLDSITWADHVLVVDMFSSDDTEGICTAYKNVSFHSREDFIYGNVNFGFDQATTDWVIRLDSDEVLNDELQQSILRFLENPPANVVGCWFPSVQFMFGQPMRFGPGLGGPPRRCMFQRGIARYPCVSEHEDFSVTVDGEWVTLSGYYSHHTNATVREVVTKYVYYAEKDASRSSAGPGQKPLRVLWQGLRLFWLYYWTRQGRREGMLGFYAAIMRGPVQHWIMNAEMWHTHELAMPAKRDKVEANA